MIIFTRNESSYQPIICGLMTQVFSNFQILIIYRVLNPILRRRRISITGSVRMSARLSVCLLRLLKGPFQAHGEASLGLVETCFSGIRSGLWLPDKPGVFLGKSCLASVRQKWKLGKDLQWQQIHVWRGTHFVVYQTVNSLLTDCSFKSLQSYFFVAPNWNDKNTVSTELNFLVFLVSL